MESDLLRKMDHNSDKPQIHLGIERPNDGLTDEELTLLRRAEDDLRRAQAAYDELEPLRRKRASMFRSKRTRRRKVPTTEELDVQKQLIDERCRNRDQRLKDKANKCTFIYSVQNDNELPTSPEEFATAFRKIGHLDQFAEQFQLTRRAAMQMLKSAGVDVVESIAKEWESGMSLRDLAHKHGPTPQTLSSWIKSTGRRIKPRNSNQKYDLSRMSELFSEKWTTNKIAQEMNLSWATVQKARVAC